MSLLRNKNIKNIVNLSDSRIMTKKNIIRQHNDYVTAPYGTDFGVHEIKITEFLIAELKDIDRNLIKQNQNKEFIISATKMAEILNTSLSRVVADGEKLANSITTKRIIEKKYNENGEIIEFQYIPIITLAKYSRGIFLIAFNCYIMKYFFDINKNFTEFQLHYLLSMSSAYAIKLYKLLYQYKNIKYRVFSIDELKEQFGLQEKYSKYGDFKKYIIDSSINQINKKTDLHIEYKEIKLGRKVEKIEFTFYVKKGMENPILLKNHERTNIIDVKPIVLNETIIKEQNTELSKLLSGIESELSKQTKKILEDFYHTKGIEFVEASIKYAKHHAKTNLDQYLTNTLTQNWAEVEYKKLLEKKEQKLKSKELKRQQKQVEQQKIQEKIYQKQKIEEEWNFLSDGQLRYVEYAKKIFTKYKDKLSFLKDIATILPICCYAVSHNKSYDNIIEGYCIKLLNIELKIQ